MAGSGRPFPVGERIVEFVVHTDSPITPAVTLKLRMIGSRTPPFILTAGGDLTWPQGLAEPASREIRILTVEGPTRRPPPQLGVRSRSFASP